MPPDTIKVDRSTPWGNPFLIGRHGTQEQCVKHYQRLLLEELICLNENAPGILEQGDYREHVLKHLPQLRGKKLACWCRFGSPCHADVLIALANRMS